jgi:integrase
MPRKPKKERVPCEYFAWLLGTRNGVYYADGRGGDRNLGRHSLGTRDRGEALELLRKLDLIKDVEAGLADAALLKAPGELLPLEEGRRRYMEHVTRPAVQGGAAPSTQARYRTVFDKFAEFAGGTRIRYWQQVNKDALGRYGKWLEDRDYHDKTQYIELTVIKQALKWMVEEGLLPAGSLFRMPLKKPAGTSTYCYTREQVQAIVARCRAGDELTWLAGVVVALSYTGLRISELADLRWGDIDLEKGILRLTDTTRRGRKSQRREARSTKSHRDRALPIHPELRPVLEGLPRRADGRVFHGPLGGKIKPDTVRNVLKREVLGPLAAQFPAAGGSRGIAAGRLHSFRHFFCSMSADSGVPEQMLMSFLGHRDSEMIRHYYHLQQEEARKQMSKLPSLSGEPAEPAPPRKDQQRGDAAGGGGGQE